jgi:hypothetical protein
MRNSLAWGAALTLFLAACASAPAPHPVTAQAASKAAAPTGCVPHTATRLPVNERDCGAFGQSYTGEDIHSTGQTDVGQALFLLDPAIKSSSPP